MLKATLVTKAPFNNGEIFKRDSPLNRDNLLVFFHFLQDSFAKRNIDLNTQDINRPQDSGFVIHNEMPPLGIPSSSYERSSLLLVESELIRPDNWDLKKHLNFSKIFTWHDSFVGKQNYYKLNFSSIRKITKSDYSSKTKLCTLIASNKSSTHPLELYSKRKEAIDWFESNCPDSFDYYGSGWNSRPYSFDRDILSRIKNKLIFLNKAQSMPSRCYRGFVDDKIKVQKDYKFSICYENAKDIPGYITEKILDCLYSSVIPVYWGAPNISSYIPEFCYIDKTKFSSYEELYDFMTQMKEEEYNARTEAIRVFLTSEKFLTFDAQLNAERICSVILGESIGQ